jgi:hypothetical protein
MGRFVNVDVLDRGEQDTPFQVFERGSEFDTARGAFAIACIDCILSPHGPSWAKRPAFRVIANAIFCHELWREKRRF